MRNIDFSNIPERGPVDEGIYLLRIAEATEKLSSTSNPMLALTYDIVADESGNPVDGNRKVWDNCSYQEKALFKLKELCDSLGYDTSEGINFDETEIIGMEVKGKLVQESYNGEIRNRVKKVYPAG